jgi:putative ABC transport system ATP-binding protein
MAILEIRDLHYGYGSGKDRHEVLRGLNASFEQGQFYAVTGKSGAGKSTLLSLLSALTLPQQGEILFEGTPTSALDPLEYRRRCVAVVYQDFALFPLLNVTENIMYPMELCGVPQEKALADARALAAQVGLGEELLSRYPSAISGGEQQFTALCKVLAAQPKLLLLDEHTAALDPATAAKVLDLSDRIVAEHNLTTLMITHNMTDAIQHGNRLIMMNEGQIILDIRGEEKKHLTRQELLEKFAALAGTPMETDSVLLS